MQWNRSSQFGRAMLLSQEEWGHLTYSVLQHICSLTLQQTVVCSKWRKAVHYVSLSSHVVCTELVLKPSELGG